MWLTKEGAVWRARLRPSYASRFALALCWVFWTVGWTAGVAVGFRAFLHLLLALLRPIPLVAQASTVPTSAAGAVLAAMFLLAWVLVWTPVGVVVQMGLLWALAGLEQVTMDARGVTRKRRWGPWHRELRVRYSDLTDLSLLGPGNGVMALLPSGRTVALAQNGTREQHQELWARMRELSGLGGPAAELKRHMPKGKEAVPLAGGGEVLRPARHIRVLWVWFHGVMTALLVGAVACLVWRQLFDGASLLATLLAVGLGALAALLAWRGWRTLQARNGWEVHPGVLVRIHHGLWRVTRVRHQVTELQVERHRPEEDDDGDPKFALWLRSPQGSRVLMRGTVDVRSLEHLGHWLAHRLDVPLSREALDVAGPSRGAA
ncbi:conjugal transfer protein TraG [Myxococcus eversor]|uniref:conjugal transfer protein TraG n=1 Tax=Myxococcus eversor TaxID=2709661 RepID=UPI0013D7A4BC|nr:conjugal transfer protein TraG [Myxococcus eversor]